MRDGRQEATLQVLNDCDRVHWADVVDSEDGATGGDAGASEMRSDWPTLRFMDGTPTFLDPVEAKDWRYAQLPQDCGVAFSMLCGRCEKGASGARCALLNDGPLSMSLVCRSALPAVQNNKKKRGKKPPRR